MAGGWFPAVDSREACAPFTRDGFGDLMVHTFRSGVRKECLMVRFYLHLTIFGKLMDDKLRHHQRYHNPVRGRIGFDGIFLL